MKNIDWHAGFVSAMKLELLANEGFLTFDEEHYLANRAQRIDLLIIKNEKDVPILNPIGAMFSKFNICEYKSPDDTLTYGDFYKVLAYTSLYLNETRKNYVYGADAYTMTFVRESHPYKLFRLLETDGIRISCSQPGIYMLTDNLPFRTQVIITAELSEPAAADYSTWLKCLTRKGTDDVLDRLLENTPKLDEHSKKYADNVMNIFTRANRNLVGTRLRREKGMCEAVNELVREIYADEIKDMKNTIANQDSIIADKDSQLADKDSQIADKDSQIADKDSQIADKDSQIAEQATIISQLKAQLSQMQAAGGTGA